MAELLKKGVIAGQTPRNAQSFDILATNGKQNARIRVKIKSGKYELWQFAAKKDGTIFRDICDIGDFVILVDLCEELKDIKFYILPTQQVDIKLKNDFEKWKNAPVKRGDKKKHDPKKPKRNISQVEHAEFLKPFLNDWDSLWNLA
jgi:hypothetical protein